MKHTIEVFSAGCSTCTETVDLVKRLAGPESEVHVRDMHQPEIAKRAHGHRIRSLPAVVIDGKLAGCCSGRGPDEHVLREEIGRASCRERV